jgi:hypothetical protein
MLLSKVPVWFYARQFVSHCDKSLALKVLSWEDIPYFKEVHTDAALRRPTMVGQSSPRGVRSMRSHSVRFLRRMLAWRVKTASCSLLRRWALMEGEKY